MLSVDIVFIAVAGIAFLGFLLNALFGRIRIPNVLPLMLIGLLVGPVLRIVDVGTSSIVYNLAPYITAIAVAFVLFDVGLNINISRLKAVFARATAFTLVTAAITGVALAAIAYYSFGWSMIEALIFGFALSGPSSIIVPTLVKLIKPSPQLTITLVYESVVTDSLQLIIPILLFSLLLSAGITTGGVVSLVADAIGGSILLGAVLSLFWLYIVKKFKSSISSYRWMLTITMVIATYGIAQQLGANGALATFVFGLLFSNIGTSRLSESKALKPDSVSRLAHRLMVKVFSISELGYIKDYQREIVFFASTFFFVYIGLLFDVSSVDMTLLAIGAAITAAVIIIRAMTMPMIGRFMRNGSGQLMRSVVPFDIPRGLSSAVVATLPLTLGLVIPHFLDQIFIVVLFTNIASTIGIFSAYRLYGKKSGKKEPKVQSRSQQAVKQVGP